MGFAAAFENRETFYYYSSLTPAFTYFCLLFVFFLSFFGFGSRVSFFVDVDLLFLCKWISKFWRRNCFGIFAVSFCIILAFFSSYSSSASNWKLSKVFKANSIFFAYFFFTPNRNNFNKTIGLMSFISFSMIPHFESSCKSPILYWHVTCFPFFHLIYIYMFCSISLAWFDLKYFSFWITKVDETILLKIHHNIWSEIQTRTVCTFPHLRIF